MSEITCFICEQLGKCITPDECYEAETTEHIKREEQIELQLDENNN